jgi:hypothetical protein
MQSPLKGQPVKNVSMVEQYYPKTIAFMLVFCSTYKLEEKVDQEGDTVGSAWNLNFSANSNLYSKRL